jgi:hypothetical protein
VEHYPLLYEDAKEMVEYVAQVLKQISRKATIPLYSLPLDSPAEDDRAGRLGVLLLGNAKSEMPGKRLIRKRDMY